MGQQRVRRPQIRDEGHVGPDNFVSVDAKRAQPHATNSCPLCGRKHTAAMVQPSSGGLGKRVQDVALVACVHVVMKRAREPLIGRLSHTLSSRGRRTPLGSIHERRRSDASRTPS